MITGKITIPLLDFVKGPPPGGPTLSPVDLLDVVDFSVLQVAIEMTWPKLLELMPGIRLDARCRSIAAKNGEDLQAP